MAEEHLFTLGYEGTRVTVWGERAGDEWRCVVERADTSFDDEPAPPPHRSALMSLPEALALLRKRYRWPAREEDAGRLHRVHPAVEPLLREYIERAGAGSLE